MSDFRKDNLAREILNGKSEYSDLISLASSSKFPSFEVRTVGSAGTVQLKFPHREWIQPLEWARNHVNTLTQQLYSDLQRIQDISPDAFLLEDLGYYSRSRILTIVGETIPEKLDVYLQTEAAKGQKVTINDVTEFLRLTNWLD